MLRARIAERLSLWLSVSYGGLGNQGRLRGWEHQCVCVLYTHSFVCMELEKRL